MKRFNLFVRVCQFMIVPCFALFAISLKAQDNQGSQETEKENQSTEEGSEKEDGGMYESDWYDETVPEETETVGDTLPTPSSTFSLMIGGVPLENSLLLLSKGGIEFGHFGAYLEVSRDDLLNTREDKSQDHYFRWNYSVTGRVYSGTPGRGLFAELAVTYSYLALWVTETNGETFVSKGNIPTTGLGLGYRLNRKPKGIFGEVGARANMFIIEKHIYTEFLPPSDSRDEYISDRSWFFEPGKFYLMFYVALGVSF